MKVLVVLLSLALASQAGAWTSSFGTEGRDGSSGQNGSSGSSGQSVLIQANQSSPQSFYLDGEDGRDAGPGQDGDHAYNCYQRLENNDLEGADGGDAGVGGHGGSGGSGGDATIYYTDTAQLKKILISAVGGRGGNGSYGGRGGEGCRCTELSWVVPKCREVIDPAGAKHTVCDEFDRYTCRDGDPGRDGANGGHGSDGRLGSVTLIKSKSRLLPEATSLSVSLSQFSSNKVADALLTENLFIRGNGVLSLLAPGSRVSDYYTEFSRRAEEKVRIVWDAKKQASSYDGTISVYINGGAVSFNVSSSEVLLTEERLENNIHTLYIRDAYNLSEFNILGLTMEGQKTSTLIRVKGSSPRLDLVDDTIRVKISRKRLLLGYKEVYNAIVPDSILQRVGSDLLINVGKLKFAGDEDTWKTKTEVKIELEIYRRIKGSSDSISRKAVFFNEQK